MEITDREILYQSEIHFTPIKDHDLIDAVAVAVIVEKEYQKAGISAEEIDTGAVIITGETAKKQNAKNILDKMAGLAGDFVVATAGANLESILAGKGSGAALNSRNTHKITANIDVGGGTSNIGVFKEGQTIDTACLNIGGRLVELKKNSDQVTYIAEPVKIILRECGIDLLVGEKVSFNILEKIAEKMAQKLIEAVITKEHDECIEELLMTESLRSDYEIQQVTISGGVADYVYGDYKPVTVSDITCYGDIGPMLGLALRKEFKKRNIKLVKPLETIRATVIGAGIHSINISGSTIHVNEKTLPLRNVTVITPFTKLEKETCEDMAEIIDREVKRITFDTPDKQVALAIKAPSQMTYQGILELAKGIKSGMRDYLKRNKPLVVVLEEDCGKILGQSLGIMLENTEIIVIDQIKVDEGDYIDIGIPIMGGIVVPVVVKTLVFEGSI